MRIDLQQKTQTNTLFPPCSDFHLKLTMTICFVGTFLNIYVCSLKIK